MGDMNCNMALMSDTNSHLLSDITDLYGLHHWTKKWICIKFAQRKYDAKMCLHQSKPVAKAVNTVFATIFAHSPADKRAHARH